MKNTLVHLTLSLPRDNFYRVRSQILVLDQLIIPPLIFFFILITCLLDVVLNCKEKFYTGHSCELKG